MIYTVTFNPSIDYVVDTENFAMGKVNRAKSDNILAGGKGINVSIVLNNLGIKSTVLGFIAGFTGLEIERRVKAAGCGTDFIMLDSGNSRINIKIKDKKETDINAIGPKVDKEHIEKFWEQIEALESGDMLILAGSIPASVPSQIYRDIMKRVANKNIKVVVDAQGMVLHDILNLHPYVVKPNQTELYELFDVKVTTIGEAIPYAKKIRDMGAKNAIISLGEVGAVLAAEDGKVYTCIAPRGNAVNTVGAGDSMIAGFLTGMMAEIGCENALKLGVAAGSASAFSKELGTKKEIQEVYETL